MFGLTIREQLMKVIVNACRNNLPSLKNEILALSSDVTDAEIVDIIGNYQDCVSNTVIEILKGASGNAYSRFQMAFLSPPLCNLDTECTDGPLSAGVLYALAYYAMADKIAASKDCLALNHMQRAFIDQILNCSTGQ